MKTAFDWWKDWYIDVGKTSGCRVRQICVGIPFGHFLAVELSHCHGCSETSSWPDMNFHYLFLADASLSNIVSLWSGTLALLKKGHLISGFVFDKWPVKVVFFFIVCFFQMCGNGRKNHPLFFIEILSLNILHGISNLTSEPNWWQNSFW